MSSAGQREQTADDRRSDALNKVVAAAGALLDPQALAELAVRHVRDVTGAHGSQLYWWDERMRVLTPLAYLDEHKEEPDPHLHPGQGLVGSVATDGRERIVADYATELEHPLSWSTLRSGAAVPLMVDGRPQGVLSCVHHEHREFDQHDLVLLRAMAVQLAPALMSMRLLAQAQRRAAEAHALSALMLRGAAEGESDSLLGLIAKWGCRLLGADVAGVSLRDPDGRTTAWGGVYGTVTDAWRGLTYPPDSHIAREVFTATRPVVSSATGDPPIGPDTFPFLHAEGARTGLSIPLRTGGETFGSLVFGWRFSLEIAEEHEDFGSALAGFAAVLTDQARRRSQLRAVVNSAPVVLAAIDASGTVTMCEGSALEALGLPGDLTGRSARDVLADAPEVLEQVTRARREGDLHREVSFRGRTFDAAFLPREAGGYLVATDVTDRRRAQSELRHQATHDLLTGLPNRALVVERAQLALELGPLTALVVDLRSFDAVNDTVGHDAGDELLVELGRRLVADLPDAAVIGRTGGDEFAIVSPGSTPEAARAVAARMVEVLKQPIRVGGEELHVTGRWGLAVSEPGQDATTLLRRADAALQSARRSGVSEVVWDAERAERRRHVLELTGDARRAVTRGELDVAFQPIIDITTGRPLRVETLCRWTHPERGEVPPDEFIPLVEGSGLMGELTRWVLDQALAGCSGWRADGQDVAVAVNVSATDLHEGGLADVVADALRRNELPPEALYVEVTETALVGEAGLAHDALQALCDLGVTVSIDDFGTGWSSLAYLKRLPAGEIKLDRSFVGSMARDGTDAAIVRSAIDLGGALGVNVVAEGVEDESTKAMLADLGCVAGQGFLFARPMPGDAIKDWLASR